MTIPPKILVDVDPSGHPVGATLVTRDGLEVPLPGVLAVKRIYSNERRATTELVLRAPIEERAVPFVPVTDPGPPPPPRRPAIRVT